MGLRLLRQDGLGPDLKALAAWARGKAGFSKPRALGEGLVWVYHNRETGCRFDVLFKTGNGLRMEIPLPQALVLGKEILRALEELAGRFGLVPPAEVRFEREQARTVGFLEQFREQNHRVLLELLKKSGPGGLPPPIDRDKAMDWWQWEMDRPGFVQRMGAEVEAAKVQMWRGEPGEIVLLSTEWKGEGGWLCPEVDLVEISLPRRNWLGRVSGIEARWLPFASVLEAVPQFQKVGCPYPLWLLPFQFREAALQILEKLPPLAKGPEGTRIGPGEFVDDPPLAG